MSKQSKILQTVFQLWKVCDVVLLNKDLNEKQYSQSIAASYIYYIIAKINCLGQTLGYCKQITYSTPILYDIVKCVTNDDGL